MKLRVHVECDNPSCKSSGQSESPDMWLEEAELKVVKNVAPPYGWLLASVNCYGPGPSVNVVVCKIECLEPAAIEAFRQEVNK